MPTASVPGRKVPFSKLDSAKLLSSIRSQRLVRSTIVKRKYQLHQRSDHPFSFFRPAGACSRAINSTE